MKRLTLCLLPLFLSASPAAAYVSSDQSIFGTVIDSASDRGSLDMEEEFREWQYGGRVEVGYQARTGSTERTDLNSRILFGAEKGRWINTIEARVVSADDDTGTVEERYFLATKSEFAFTENNYLFAAVNAEKDRIRNIERQTTEAVGYGRRLVTTDHHRLDAELGIGGRQIRFRDNTPRENERIMRFASVYEWEINDTASFSQDIRVESSISGVDRTFGESITTFSSTLVGELALTLSYTVRYLEDKGQVQEEPVDTITSVGLNYQF